jgi:hypothetical protein
MLGDHIRALKDGRWIHGIDLGTQQVLHLVEDPSLPAGHRLRRTYKPDFTEGATSVEVVIHRERVFPPRMVVARAFSRLADPAVVAAFRSSEQFAAWCKASRLPAADAEAQPPARKKVGARKTGPPAGLRRGRRRPGRSRCRRRRRPGRPRRGSAWPGPSRRPGSPPAGRPPGRSPLASLPRRRAAGRRPRERHRADRSYRCARTLACAHISRGARRSSMMATPRAQARSTPSASIHGRNGRNSSGGFRGVRWSGLRSCIDPTLDRVPGGRNPWAPRGPGRPARRKGPGPGPRSDPGP